MCRWRTRNLSPTRFEAPNCLHCRSAGTSSGSGRGRKALVQESATFSAGTRPQRKRTWTAAIGNCQGPNQTFQRTVASRFVRRQTRMQRTRDPINTHEYKSNLSDHRTEGALGSSACHRDCGGVLHLLRLPGRRRLRQRHASLAQMVGRAGCWLGLFPRNPGARGPGCRPRQGEQASRGSQLSHLSYFDPWDIRDARVVFPRWRSDHLAQLSYWLGVADLVALV
jgi:hypothetical protein